MADVLVQNDWEIGFNGILIGPDSPYSLTDEGAKGLQGATAARSSDRPRLMRHGSRPGRDYLGERTIIMQFVVRGTPTISFNDAVTEFTRATRPGMAVELPLIFQIPGIANGRPARIYCKPRAQEVVVDRAYFVGEAVFDVMFVATDPRVYSDAASGASTTLPIAGTGFGFPFAFPFGFGAVGSGGSMSLDNAGSHDAPVVFRLDGPLSDPRIENLSIDKKLEFNIDLLAGDYLIIDTNERSVILNGQESRMFTLTSDSRWFDLAPGSNTITFRAASDSDGTLSATWRSAYI